MPPTAPNPTVCMIAQAAAAAAQVAMSIFCAPTRPAIDPTPHVVLLQRLSALLHHLHTQEQGGGIPATGGTPRHVSLSGDVGG